MEKPCQLGRFRKFLWGSLLVLGVLVLIGAGLPQPGLAAASTSTPTYVSYKTPTPTPKATSKSKGKPSISASYTDNYLEIGVENFPSYAVYYIRATTGNYRGNEWYHIGRMRTNKNGKASASFRLPEKMSQAGQVNVCLKNVITDATLCQSAWK